MKPSQSPSQARAMPSQVLLSIYLSRSCRQEAEKHVFYVCFASEALKTNVLRVFCRLECACDGLFPLPDEEMGSMDPAETSNEHRRKHKKHVFCVCFVVAYVCYVVWKLQKHVFYECFVVWRSPGGPKVCSGSAPERRLEAC